MHAKQRDLHQNDKSIWVPAITCVYFSKQNSDFWTRITTLNGSQTSPVLLCMQNSVICTRMTSLYGFQPSPVFIFPSKTATFGLELQLSMVLRPHLSFCACKTAWFAPEWQVYMGSSHHLCLFFHAKQRLYDQTYKSVWVPDLICGFDHT